MSGSKVDWVDQSFQLTKCGYNYRQQVSTTTHQYALN
jgi:hypothetical protein